MNGDLKSLSDADLLALAQQHLGNDAPPAPAQRTWAEQLQRGAGLAGRALIRGATGIPTLMAEAVYQPTKALFDYNNPGNKVTSQTPSPSQTIERLMTRAGLPQPESGTERLATNIGSALSGAGAVQGVLGALSPVTQVGQGIRSAMMTQPVRQGVAAGTGASSATLAGEMGAGPVGQTIAGFAGSMLPFVPQMVRSAPTPETMQRNEVLRRGIDEGYVIPPSQSNPNMVNKTLGGVSGQFATEQSASIKNQNTTNLLAKKAIGVPEDSALSIGKLEQVRNEASAPYREIAQISPSAKNLLEDLKQARFNANENWNFYKKSGNPEARVQWETYQAQANKIEDLFERYATSINRPGLVDSLRSARERIAKTYDVEKALNVSTGDIDAKIIGNLHDKTPNKFSGPLKTIGEFANAAPQAVQDRVGKTPPFISPIDLYSGLGLAGGGAMYSGSTTGLIAGALPLVRPMTRGLILSKPYQSVMAQPDVSRLGVMDSAGLGLLSGIYGK